MYLLDTNIIIDFCNDKLPDNAMNFLEKIEPKISVITSIELFGSAKIVEQERLKLELLVSIATVYDNINKEIVNRCIAIRQQHKTKLPDAIIAATAIAHNLTLITRNTNDFKNIDSLQIINPHNL